MIIRRTRSQAGELPPEPPFDKKVSEMTRGEKVCAFIERYVHVPEGAKVGQLMKLLPFQRKFVLAVYDSPYSVHTAILSMARRNGKTALIAALLLAHIAGPQAIQNSQIVSGAQSLDQAGVVFELARKMISLSPELEKVIIVQPSQKRLIGIRKNVIYRALANSGKTAHGISPVLVILDELGQVEGPTDKFVDALRTAQGSYEHPLLIVISTQAASDNDLLSIMIDSQLAAPDPRVVCHVYSAPDNCALDDREAWAMANPALGVFRSITDLEKQATAAIRMPSQEATFCQLGLNMRVEAGSPFISRSVWKENNAPPGEIEGKKVWAGLDLSSVQDLTALVAVAEDGGVHSAFWLPKEGLAEKSRLDRVSYDLWAKDGYLNTTPGKAIEYEAVAEYLRGFFDRCEVVALGFDRYLMNHLKPWLVKANFSDAELSKFVPFGQGTQSMTPALRELETKLLNKQLAHGDHPILSMCMFNAVVTGDSGARKFDKKLKRGRIDGAVALAMAVGVMPLINEAKQVDVKIWFT